MTTGSAGWSGAASDRPTLDTVAAAAGVSRMTVSNAYNHPDQLSAATRARVLETAHRLGYQGPDPTAASLRLGRTGTVGVVLTERLPYAFADPGMVSILHGIATELSSAGNALALVPSSRPDGQSLLRHAMVDGLILCGVDDADTSVPAALARHLPMVTVGNPRLVGIPWVGIDNRRTAALVADHLLGLGHRRFAAITTAVGEKSGPHPLFVQRVEGFRNRLLANGVNRDDIEVTCAAENSRIAAHELGRDVLARPPDQRPTALFAVTDILALGILDATTELGAAVPGDLSLVGFDGIPESATSTPPLTTISQRLFTQGSVAAQLVLHMIAGKTVRVSRFTAKLEVRASTSSPRAVAAQL
ncbi:MAG: LacI family DNA-binding transcriptional regulator [Acidimicrobiales bacterium]|jgi:DNA-binding LacI/PurR family transcriptional regulator